MMKFPLGKWLESLQLMPWLSFLENIWKNCFPIFLLVCITVQPHLTPYSSSTQKEQISLPSVLQLQRSEIQVVTKEPHSAVKLFILVYTADGGSCRRQLDCKVLSVWRAVGRDSRVSTLCWIVKVPPSGCLVSVRKTEYQTPWKFIERILCSDNRTALHGPRGHNLHSQALLWLKKLVVSDPTRRIYLASEEHPPVFVAVYVTAYGNGKFIWTKK